MFDDWFDPCPFDPRWTKNGLMIDWPDKTFINPPYSSPMKWVEKAIFHHNEGKRMVLLLKHDSSTKWYKSLHQESASFLMVDRRLKYQTGKSAPFPSILAVLTHKWTSI
tara:strand:+ start:428 stop:754 length:327 start_codon:yes stop_codon:yes gene_type:complete